MKLFLCVVALIACYIAQLPWYRCASLDCSRYSHTRGGLCEECQSWLDVSDPVGQ